MEIDDGSRLVGGNHFTYYVMYPLRIREPHPVSQRLAVHKSDEERKTDAGKDRSDTPVRSGVGKAIGIYLPPTAWQCVAVRGFRIAGSVDGGKMQRRPCARKTGFCISYIATDAAPPPLPASRQSRDGVIAGSFRPRSMGKSSCCPPLFAPQDT